MSDFRANGPGAAATAHRAESAAFAKPTTLTSANPSWSASAIVACEVRA